MTGLDYTPAGTAVDLVTCHLKSKLLTFPGGAFSTRDEALRARYGAYALYRRAAEAVTVRDTATQLLAGQGQQRAVVVLGDLNDGPDAATTQTCPDHPVPRSAPAVTTPPTRVTAPDCGTSTRASSPPENRYSRIYRGHPELIDHIFVSHLVTHHVGDGDVTAGAPTAPAPASITDNPNTRRDAPASDHRPLIATIDL